MTKTQTVVRVLKFVRGDSDIRGAVVKIVRVLKFVRMRILKIQKSDAKLLFSTKRRKTLKNVTLENYVFRRFSMFFDVFECFYTFFNVFSAEKVFSCYIYR